jgi:hypothetical protein
MAGARPPGWLFSLTGHVLEFGLAAQVCADMHAWGNVITSMAIERVRGREEVVGAGGRGRDGTAFVIRRSFPWSRLKMDRET